MRYFFSDGIIFYLTQRLNTEVYLKLCQRSEVLKYFHKIFMIDIDRVLKTPLKTQWTFAETTEEHDSILLDELYLLRLKIEAFIKNLIKFESLTQSLFTWSGKIRL